MSKAEDRASELHILMWDTDFYNGFIKGYDQAEKDLHKSVYKAGFLDGFEDAVEGQYEKGYAQAEKDLELTWEDMQNIRNIISDMMVESYTRNSSWSTHEEFSKEILKRFKEMKETKD